MRKALNENPVVQLSVLGVLLLVAGVFMAPKLLGGKDEPAAPATSDPSVVAASGTGVETPGATATAAPAGTVPTTDPSAAVPADPSAAPPPADTSTGTVAPEALIPGPGLPREVASAWDRGDAIVLLVVKNSAIDDRKVKASVSAISKPGVAVFVAKASDVARYSRITQPVGLNRVPALVVVRPSDVSGKTPEAQVSYGFRGSKSVVQAVEDALYSGKDNGPYHPG
jgi:hypothetical protein